MLYERGAPLLDGTLRLRAVYHQIKSTRHHRALLSLEVPQKIAGVFSSPTPGQITSMKQDRCHYPEY